MSQKPTKSLGFNKPSSFGGYPASMASGTVNAPQFLQFRKEYEEFRLFVRNSLLSLRKELENVLYACFLQLLRLALEFKKEDINEKFKLFRSILETNKNIFLNPRLMREIIQLISASVTAETFQAGFPELAEKLSLSSSKNMVFLSEFAYECFFSFIEIEKKSAIMNSLSSFLSIKILKDPVSEANFKCEFLRSQGIEDLEKLSTGAVGTLPPRSDFDFYVALDALSKKRAVSRKGKGSELYFLTDSLKGLTNNQPDSNVIAIPEVKLANRVNFAQNYIERVPLSEGLQPSILQITVADSQEALTCVEIGVNGNVFLAGNLDSSIMLWVLNPDFFEEVSGKVPGENEKNEKEGEKANSELLYYRFVGHSAAITSLSLLYDELFFLSASVDTSIRLWCIRSRTCLLVYQGHINTIWRVKFSPKGYYFASGSSDTTAKLWTMDRLSPVRIFLGHNADVTIVDFIQNLQFLVTAALDSRIIFWEIASGTKVRVLFHYQETVTSLSISPSGIYMVTGSEEGSVILWDLVKFLRINCWDLEGSTSQARSKNDIRNKILISGFAIDESYLMVGSRKKLGLYLLKSIKEKRNEDIYKDLKEEEEEKEKEVGLKEGLERNFFDNQNYDFFLAARFHDRNHIILASKSL